MGPFINIVASIFVGIDPSFHKKVLDDMQLKGLKNYQQSKFKYEKKHPFHYLSKSDSFHTDRILNAGNF